jgi:DNA polymerase III epsilon subunit-like protein
MNKLLVIDIETTGFLPKGGKIVEVGIVELDIETGCIKALLDVVCREGGFIDPKAWIFNNSSLTVEDVGKAPRFSGKWGVEKVIQGIIDQYPLGATAFNRDFDVKFLQSREILFGKLQPCPMLVATDICKLPGHRGYKWPKVEEAWEFFFPYVPYVEEHRGADDAMHEAQIVYEMIKTGVYEVER